MSFQEYALLMLAKGNDAEQLRNRSKEYERARQEAEALRPVLAAIDELEPNNRKLISAEAEAIEEKAKPRFNGEPLEIKAYTGQVDGRFFLIAPVEVDENTLFLESTMLDHYQAALKANGKKVKKSTAGDHIEFSVGLEDAKELKRIMAALIEQPEALAQANVTLSIEYASFESLSGNGQKSLPTSRKALPSPEKQGAYQENASDSSLEKGSSIRKKLILLLGATGGVPANEIYKATPDFSRDSVKTRLGEGKNDGIFEKGEERGSNYQLTEAGQLEYAALCRKLDVSVSGERKPIQEPATRSKQQHNSSTKRESTPKKGQTYAHSDGTMLERVYSFVERHKNGVTASQILDEFEGENKYSITSTLYALKKDRKLLQEGGRGSPYVAAGMGKKK